jgi:hypothetical protein
VQIGSFIGATHVTVGEVSRIGNTISLNARTVAVDTGVVLAEASKTVDGPAATAFDIIDLLSTYVLKGLTNETKIFAENVLEHEFTIKPARYRTLNPPFKRPCEPILQKTTPAITISCVAEYYPATGVMELAKGTDKVRRLDLLVNDEVVASFVAQPADSTVEKALTLDLGPANVTTQAKVEVVQSEIKKAPVSVIKEVRGKVKIRMQR